MLSRLLFYPTLLSNVVINQLGIREWYTRIDDTVLLGALPFRSMTAQLKADGVTGVVTMNEQYETKYFCNTKQEWDAHGIEQLRLDTADFVASPSLEKLSDGVEFIEHHQQRDGRVYVHCKAGRTRSTTLVACYLIKKHNWSADEAVSFIKDKRSHIVLRQAQWTSLREYKDHLDQLDLTS